LRIVYPRLGDSRRQEPACLSKWGVVADRVEIDVNGEAEAGDLQRALAVRGLPGLVRLEDDRQTVVLDCPYEGTDSLLRDLLPALEAWRIDRRRGALKITVGGRAFQTGGNSPAGPTKLAGAGPSRPSRARAA
jgi:hypothetical protein